MRVPFSLSRIIIIIIIIIIITRKFLRFLWLLTLYNRRFRLDAFVVIYVHSVSKICPSLLDITGIPVLPHNFINPSPFTATCKTSPSARCVSAANLSCQDVDITNKPAAPLWQVLR
jgi:hypothetical protein